MLHHNTNRLILSPSSNSLTHRDLSNKSTLLFAAPGHTPRRKWQHGRVFTQRSLPDDPGMGFATSHNRACSLSNERPYMYVSAGVKELTGSVTNVEGLRFAMVVGRFNEFVTRPLVAGALGAFKTHSVKESDIDVVWVPGSFEIPLVAQNLAKTGKYHAVLCIGTVIRGETTHYDAVANSAASGVLSAGLNSGVPCIFGVLTCETLEQALHRAGGKAGNKGAEAALTAIEMASLFQHHLQTLK